MASRCPIPLAFMHAAEFLPAKVQHQTLPFQLQPFSNGVCSIDGGHQSMGTVPSHSAQPAQAQDATSNSVLPGHLPPLDIACAGNCKIMDIHDYGEYLRKNKSRISQLADAMYKESNKDPNSGIYPQRKAIMVAIAMLETTYMDVSQRDASKDHTPAANVTILNLNYDMLHQIGGYTAPDYGMELNHGDQGLKKGLFLLDQCFNKYPIKNILDFHRGGYTGFHDGMSYDCYGYRNAISTVYKQINSDPAFLTDGRRIEISVKYE